MHQRHQNRKQHKPPDVRTATRFATNHNWCFRGDNTKYKAKK